MHKGTVKFFNKKKGFGFIKPSDGSQEIFYHFSDAVDTVDIDEPVEYEVISTKKGLAAVKVKRYFDERFSF